MIKLISYQDFAFHSIVGWMVDLQRYARTLIPNLGLLLSHKAKSVSYSKSCDEVKDIERRRIAWITQVDSKCNHMCPCKRERGKFNIAEEEATRPWGRAWSDGAPSQEIPGVSGSCKRQGTNVPLESLEEIQPYQYLVWTSGLQNWKRINFCRLKPPSVWWFVTAAPGN